MNLNEIKDFHVSGDLVYSVEDKYILKVSYNIARLEEEYLKDRWISKYINSPKPILFLIENKKAYYLREYLVGNNLCNYVHDPMLLIDILVKAINNLHTVVVSDNKYYSSN